MNNAVSPLVLSRVERVLETRLMRLPNKLILHALSHASFPIVAVEKFAQGMPDHEGDDVSHAFITRYESPPGRRSLHPTAPEPLAGESVVVKDSIDVAGAPTALGLAPDDLTPPALRDAVIVERVRAAGGVVIGKTKMTELGLDGLGAHVRGPMPKNPRAPGYFPGGSSTGTAVAVAARLARYGLGGDGMGSVRIPAGFCGLVGLKPTHDLLPAAGYPSVAPSMDVPGPICRDVEDCARLWRVLADEPFVSPTSWLPPKIGVIRTLGPELAAKSVRRAFEDTLRKLAVPVERVDVPLALHSAGIGMVTASDEVASGPHARRDVSPAGRVTLALVRSISHRGRARVRRQRELLRAQVMRALDRVGFLAMPTAAVPPPAVTRALRDGGQDGILLRAVGLYTPLANVVGLPAIAVPMGTDDRGRPLSIMFVGPPRSEPDLLRIARAVELVAPRT